MRLVPSWSGEARYCAYWLASAIRARASSVRRSGSFAAASSAALGSSSPRRGRLDLERDLRRSAAGHGQRSRQRLPAAEHDRDRRGHLALRCDRPVHMQRQVGDDRARSVGRAVDLERPGEQEPVASQRAVDFPDEPLKRSHRRGAPRDLDLAAGDVGQLDRVAVAVPLDLHAERQPSLRRHRFQSGARSEHAAARREPLPDDSRVPLPRLRLRSSGAHDAQHRSGDDK